MSESTLRAELKTLMEGITGVGMVHDYDRWTKDWKDFVALFKKPGTKNILGWEITRSGFTIERMTANKFKMFHQFVLRGYYSINDKAKSEKAFNVVVGDVVIAILSQGLTSAEGEVIPKSGKLEPRTFGGVLCHYVEIQVPVKEIVTKVDGEVTTSLTKVQIDYYLQEPTDDGVKDADDTLTLPGG